LDRKTEGWRQQTSVSGHFKNAAIVAIVIIIDWTTINILECRNDALVGQSHPRAMSHPSPLWFGQGGSLELFAPPTNSHSFTGFVGQNIFLGPFYELRFHLGHPDLKDAQKSDPPIE
jgi:hypothetical protein